jgi:RNase P protein component
MKLVRIDEIFDVVYGVNLEFNKLEICADGIPFVSRTQQNNGVKGFVKQLPDVQPNPANTISVAGGGSVMASFLQTRPYYSGRDLFYLKPRIQLTTMQLLLYCTLLKGNRYRFNYGRQANKTLGSLLVPPPDALKMIAIKLPLKPSKTPACCNQISLSDRDWKEFAITDLFTVRKGERLTKEDREIGNTPLITATGLQNGIATFIDKDTFMNKKHVFQDTLTLDMFFHAFYQKGEYFADDNVHSLFPKNNRLSDCAALFLATVLNTNQYKYAYGRQVRMKRLCKEKVKLPANEDGSPDWQFMENYIKSLPYSSNLSDSPS